MKHTWKKTVAACSLGLCLALSVAPCALATQSMAVPAMESAMPRYSNIRITPSLSINGGVASISVSIRPNSGYEYDLTITLQKKGLIFWGDEESWTVSGSSAKTVSKTVSVSSGTYRVLVEGTVYDANGNEVDTVSETSDSVT